MSDLPISAHTFATRVPLVYVAVALGAAGPDDIDSVAAACCLCAMFAVRSVPEASRRFRALTGPASLSVYIFLGIVGITALAVQAPMPWGLDRLVALPFLCALAFVSLRVATSRPEGAPLPGGVGIASDCLFVLAVAAFAQGVATFWPAAPCAPVGVAVLGYTTLLVIIPVVDYLVGLYRAGRALCARPARPGLPRIVFVVATMSASLRFTEREHEVFTWLVHGYSVADIARLLGVSDSTVRARLGRMCSKAHVKSAVGLRLLVDCRLCGGSGCVTCPVARELATMRPAAPQGLEGAAPAVPKTVGRRVPWRAGWALRRRARTTPPTSMACDRRYAS